MLTCFYKRILRPGDDLNPHILVVLEIQNKVKSSVENKHDHFRNILNNEFPMLKESETHGNIWRHYASMKIDIDSQSLTELPVFVKEKLDDTANMQAAIDAGWQGKSRDDFYKDFNKSIERIGADLEAEWNNLEAKIFELADNLFKQDKNMY